MRYIQHSTTYMYVSNTVFFSLIVYFLSACLSFLCYVFWLFVFLFANLRIKRQTERERERVW